MFHISALSSYTEPDRVQWPRAHMAIHSRRRVYMCAHRYTLHAGIYVRRAKCAYGEEPRGRENPRHSAIVSRPSIRFSSRDTGIIRVAESEYTPKRPITRNERFSAALGGVSTNLPAKRAKIYEQTVSGIHVIICRTSASETPRALPLAKRPKLVNDVGPVKLLVVISRASRCETDVSALFQLGFAGRFTRGREGWIVSIE